MLILRVQLLDTRDGERVVIAEAENDRVPNDLLVGSFQTRAQDRYSANASQLATEAYLSAAAARCIPSDRFGVVKR